jgi:alternate signal-mediated exported protein
VHISRLVKGIIAGGVGLALLIGGGTFALWSSTATVGTGTINSGTLTVTATNVTWTDNSGDTIDPSTFLIVPGDVLTLNADLAIDATGDNLTAQLTVTPPTTSGDLATNLTTDFSLGTLPNGITADAAPNTYDVVPSDVQRTVHAMVTVTFPDTTSGTTGQGQQLDLGATTFLLQQTT